MGFIEVSPQGGVWVLLRRSKGCVGFIEASSHPRGVWVLLRRVLIQGVCGFY